MEQGPLGVLLKRRNSCFGGISLRIGTMFYSSHSSRYLAWACSRHSENVSENK